MMQRASMRGLFVVLAVFAVSCATTPGALDDDDIADGYILGCQSKPTADRLRVEF